MNFPFKNSKKFLILLLATITFFLGTCVYKAEAISLPIVKVSNPHYIEQTEGSPFFMVADTAWALAQKLNRDQANTYLQQRANQGFNTILAVALAIPEFGLQNIYGDLPCALDAQERPLPGQLITTTGNNPSDPNQYDYWDHLDYIIATAEQKEQYVGLLPAWGSWVSGSYDGSNTSLIAFNSSNAYSYGRWLGNRYRSRKNILWVLGGDRAAVYGARDYRPIWRAMAEGIADGTNGLNNQDGTASYTSTFITYHPRKNDPSSSLWFHADAWLDSNGIQDYAVHQYAQAATDWGRTPVKPALFLEGHYEEAGNPDAFFDWQARFQAYQTVFAGVAGCAYGHAVVGAFDTGWENKINDTGALQMKHLSALMNRLNDTQYFGRIPAQDMIDGDQGAVTSNNLDSNRIQATRGSDSSFAYVYSANGRIVRVRMDRISAPRANAYWYNPRNGLWRNGTNESSTRTPFATVASGSGSAVHSFDPPGTEADENDWVLVLEKQDDTTPPAAPSNLSIR